MAKASGNPPKPSLTINMMESSKMIKSMDMAYTPGPVATFIKANITKTRDKDKAKCFGKMAARLTENGSMAFSTALVK